MWYSSDIFVYNWQTVVSMETIWNWFLGLICTSRRHTHCVQKKVPFQRPNKHSFCEPCPLCVCVFFPFTDSLCMSLAAWGEERGKKGRLDLFCLLGSKARWWERAAFMSPSQKVIFNFPHIDLQFIIDNLWLDVIDCTIKASTRLPYIRNELNHEFKMGGVTPKPKGHQLWISLIAGGFEPEDV